MKQTTRWSLVLACAVAVASLTACDVLDHENDIWITNGSDNDLEKVTLDGRDRGSIDEAETIKFDNVSNGRHELAAYRRVDDEFPCDTHQTHDLDGNEDAYWVIDNDCD